MPCDGMRVDAHKQILEVLPVVYLIACPPQIASRVAQSV
jgi:hypothetical protein